MFFNIMDLLFPVLFLIVISVFIYTIITNLKEYLDNNNSPIKEYETIITSKRTKTSNHFDGKMHHSSTNYYITFEFEDGDRKEFRIKGKEYGKLSEGDAGILKFQGSRYLEFNRLL